MDVNGQLHVLAALTPQGKNPRYPLNRRLGIPSLDAVTKMKTSQPLPEIEPRSAGP
jgi:hypothetical protein